MRDIRISLDSFARITVLAVSLWAGFRPGTARASNEDDFFVGDRAAMTGGAVTATVDDASASFYNHAGLAAAERDRLDVSAAAYGLRFYSVPRFLAVEGGPSRGASVTEFVAIPTEIAYLRKLTPSATLGLGYFVPRGGNAVLSERLEVGDADDGSTWALDLRSSTASYWLVAALGLRASQRVRVGFGLFGVYDDAVVSTAFFGSVRENGTTQKVTELSNLGKALHISGTLGAGLQVDLTRDLTLGLWARGPRLQLISSRVDSVNLVAAAAATAGEPADLFESSMSVDDSGEQVGFVTLGRYFGGAAYRFGASRLSVEIDVQPGLDSLGGSVDRDLTINARAGLTHAVTPDVLLGMGVFSDRATVDAGSSSEALDFYGGTLGVQFDDVLGLAQSERADTLVLSSVFAFRYAYGHGPTGTLVGDPEGDPSAILSTDRSEETIHELGLHVGSALQF